MSDIFQLNFVTIGFLTGLFIGIPAAYSSGNVGYTGIATLSGAVAAVVSETVEKEKQEEEKEKLKNKLTSEEVSKVLIAVAKDYEKLETGYIPEHHSSLLALAEHYQEKGRKS